MTKTQKLDSCNFEPQHRQKSHKTVARIMTKLIITSKTSENQRKRRTKFDKYDEK